jgi:RNA polymerase sigma-70 factor (ECF subfamily)
LTTASILVRKASQGDLSAFEQLVLLYQDRVYSHCVYLTGNYDDGQDLAQEVFVKAFKGISSFRGQADFGTWLHRIAVNAWINLSRSKQVVTFSIDEPLVTQTGELNREFFSEQDTPLAALEKKELSSLVRKALLSLAPEFRTALVLRELEGYSYQEIAELTGSSLGTVKSRINRARRDLKKEIESLGRL